MTEEPVNPRAAFAIALAPPPLELLEELVGEGLAVPEELPPVEDFVGEAVIGPGLNVEEGVGAPLGLSVSGPLIAAVKPFAGCAAKDADDWTPVVSKITAKNMDNFRLGMPNPRTFTRWESMAPLPISTEI
jgi:hypothetical protein